MKILVACEESQAICLALRAKGHESYSCDLQECSGGHPEWHYKGSLWDIIDAKNGVTFVTQSGNLVYIKGWDGLIGHPPCTYLSNAGNDWFNLDKYISAQQRWLNRFEAVEFFCSMFHKDIPRICLENPVGYMNGIWPPNQIIEPFFFGDQDRKRTCLWTKGLPKLIHIKEDDIWGVKTHVEVKPTYVDKDGKNRYFTDSISGNTKDSQKLRSKTFPGIADNIANQWFN